MSDSTPTYIILLRAVNVSGKNIVKMSALKTALTGAGFEKVQTYIQSGNVILQSLHAPSQIKSTIASVLSETFGLSVACFVVDAAYIELALREIPFAGEIEPNRLFITFLNQPPDAARVTTLEAVDHGEELFHVRESILYYYLPHGMAKAKMNNNYFESKLKVVGTGRNLNTLRKLLELAKNA